MTRETIKMEVGKLWMLESWFGPNPPVNEERDKWFANPLNRVFVVNKDDEGRLLFTSIATGEQWMTTPANLVAGKPSEGFCYFLTESGTMYHLVKTKIQFK